MTPPSDRGAIDAVPGFPSKTRETLSKALRTDGMLNRIKKVAHKFLELDLGLDLWSGRARCDNDVLERCHLGELAYNLHSFRQNLRVFGSYDQALRQELDRKGRVFTICVVQIVGVDGGRS